MRWGAAQHRLDLSPPRDAARLLALPPSAAMDHRHLLPSATPSLAMMDDIIARGSLVDWIALRDDLQHESAERVGRLRRMVARRLSDPEALHARYRVWDVYLRDYLDAP